MIILDTNVVSALMMSQPDAAVIDWLDQQVPESVWVTSITVFEARYGLGLLPAGRRRRQLMNAFESLLQEDLEGRVLGVDARAAACAADLAASRKTSGRSVDVRDTLIAGVAVAHAACLVTRNLRHFKDLPTPVIDPWAAGV